MIQYITSQEYSSITGETAPSDIDKLIIQASAMIQHRTHDRIDKSEPIPEGVKYATAYVIKTDINARTLKDNIGNLKSQNIEGWSESYSTPEEIDKKAYKDKQQILTTYLWNVLGVDGLPLLFDGVL